MHFQYPYNAPIILNDSVFVAYGGATGTSLPAQRSAAYLIAEMQMSSHLNTFLKPTNVTGTNYPYSMYGEKLILEHTYVNQIHSATVHGVSSLCVCTLQNYEGCAFLIDDLYGYIIVTEKSSIFCPCIGNISPISVDVIYNAGLPTGVSMQPNMLLALTLAAGINLWEITDPGALPAGAGDAGIESWSSQGYSEKRKIPGDNAFGSSVVANKIAKLVEGLPHKQGLKF